MVDTELENGGYLDATSEYADLDDVYNKNNGRFRNERKERLIDGYITPVSDDNFQHQNTFKHFKHKHHNSW